MQVYVCVYIYIYIHAEEVNHSLKYPHPLSNAVGGQKDLFPYIFLLEPPTVAVSVDATSKLATFEGEVQRRPGRVPEK